MTPTRPRRALRLAVGAASAAVAMLAAPLAGDAAPAAPASGGHGAATASVPVGYDCFVTYPGGDTVVQYSLTYDVTAPASVRRFVPYVVSLDTPPITPNPALQSDVRDVEVAFEVPDNAVVAAYWLTGGSGLGDSDVEVERSGDVLTLTASGPYASATVFDLPALKVLLVPLTTGPAVFATGGTSFEDPSFSWQRNSLSPGDPPGTYREFLCQPPADVVLATTQVMSG